MYISIDVGGTNTRVSYSGDLDKPLFESNTIRRVNTHNFEDDFGFIIDAAKQLSAGGPISAVGIGVPGKLNSEKTGLVFAKNLGTWADRSIVDTLCNGLGCNVYLDNDAVAMGLGEAYYGGLEDDFDYLIWGTGIGGSAVRQLQGRPEVSRLHWQPRFRDWEQQNGGGQLLKEYKKPTVEFTTEEWTRVLNSFKFNLRHYVQKYDPGTIVLGGGLAVLHKEVLQQFGNEIGTRIVVTKFADDSGIVGGFGLIKRGLEGASVI